MPLAEESDADMPVDEPLIERLGSQASLRRQNSAKTLTHSASFASFNDMDEFQEFDNEPQFFDAEGYFDAELIE